MIRERFVRNIVSFKYWRLNSIRVIFSKIFGLFGDIDNVFLKYFIEFCVFFLIF